MATFWGQYLWVVLVYIGLVIIGIRVLRAIRKGRVQTLQSFTYEIDRLRYQYALLLSKKRSAIYDLNKSLPILYANKKRLLADPRKSYRSEFVRIKKDMQFLESLVGEQVFSADRYEKIDHEYEYLERGAKVYQGLKIVVAILTLGLGLLLPAYE